MGSYGAGKMQQSGCRGDEQVGPKSVAGSSSAGAQKAKGGAMTKSGPKDGPRVQQSGSRGG